MKNRTHNRRRAAFTLIELMVVVAVLAIIAALAIPTLLGARKPANEASAISALRSLSTVNEQYRLRFQSYASDLPDLAATGYIDDKLGAGVKTGFVFNYTTGPFSWTCTAGPEILGTTGDRYFFINESGVIRFNNSGPATATDAPLE